MKIKSSLYVSLNFLTSTYYMITYLFLATAISYILSSSIFVYSFFTGLYLMSMGGGVIIVNKIKFPTEIILSIIFAVALFSILIINPGISGLLYFNEYFFYLFRNSTLDFTNLTFFLGVILTVILGVLSGSELPLFSKLIEKNNELKNNSLMVKILTVDYFGTFFGLILFYFFIFPVLGLTKGMFYTQLVFSGSIYINLLLIDSKWGKQHLLMLLIFIFVLISFFQQESLLYNINQLSR